MCKCKTNVFPEKEPERNGDDGQYNHRRNKHGGNPVSQLCNRSLRGSCVADKRNNLGKCGVLSHSCCTAFQETALIGGCRADPGAGLLVNRNGFSGQSSFVDCTDPFQNNTVCRNAFSGSYGKNISALHLIDGNRNLFSVPDQGCSLGSKLHQ